MNFAANDAGNFLILAKAKQNVDKQIIFVNVADLDLDNRDYLRRAWDDNFSSSDPSINNVSSWLKSNNAIYCANPTAEGIVNQFLAGGYFKSTGK